ncbi:CPBP family intramembrane glutamic endopeptidase [Salinithrix halophila]|uniref:CPBP family intramembrane glutamic endopeptidase n=1 Tax=Salinithrix halophila TaxID=1485204 RepID=A0ABV8JDE1_9BACL
MNTDRVVGPNRVPWSWKPITAVLVLTFFIVTPVIEIGLFHYLRNLTKNDLYAGTGTGAVMAVVFTLAVYVLCIRPYGLSWKAVGFRRFHRSVWKWIFLGSIFLVAVAALIMTAVEVLGFSYDNARADSIQNNRSIIGIFVALISAAVISPLYEEIVYRGVFYAFFRTRFGILMGLSINAAIFSLAHIPLYHLLPLTFIGGVVFGWLYERSGSIVPPMLAHGLSNLIFVVLSALPR